MATATTSKAAAAAASAKADVPSKGDRITKAKAKPAPVIVPEGGHRSLIQAVAASPTLRAKEAEKAPTTEQVNAMAGLALMADRVLKAGARSTDEAVTRSLLDSPGLREWLSAWESAMAAPPEEAAAAS
jgi:hypothetical protein